MPAGAEIAVELIVVPQAWCGIGEHLEQALEMFAISTDPIHPGPQRSNRVAWIAP